MLMRRNVFFEKKAFFVETLLDVVCMRRIMEATSQETVRRFWISLPQPFGVGMFATARRGVWLRSFSDLRGPEGGRGGRSRRATFFFRF